MTETVFNPLAFVIEVGGLLLDLSVCEAIDHKMGIDESTEAIITLVSEVAHKVVRTQCWDYTAFLEVYPCLRGFFSDAEGQFLDLHEW